MNIRTEKINDALHWNCVMLTVYRLYGDSARNFFEIQVPGISSDLTISRPGYKISILRTMVIRFYNSL